MSFGSDLKVADNAFSRHGWRPEREGKEKEEMEVTEKRIGPTTLWGKSYWLQVVKASTDQA